MRLLNFKMVFYKFSTRDCFALEEYLNEMLEKGWIFEKFLVGRLLFRRTEDKNKQYKLVFDDIDNPLETFEVRNKKYKEYGYNLIGVSSGVSIYSIDKDKSEFESLNLNKENLCKEKAFLENIAYYALKQKVSIIVPIIFIFSMNLYNFFSLIDEKVIFKNERILILLGTPILAMIYVLSYLKIFLWKVKSLKLINKQQKAYYPNLKKFKRRQVILNIFQLVVLSGIIGIGIIGKDIYLILGIFMGVGFFIIAILTYNLIAMDEKYKNKKLPDSIVGIISFFIIMIASFSIMTVYEEKEHKLTTYKTGYPIEIEDLGYESAGKRKPFLNAFESESILAKSFSYSEEEKSGDKNFGYIIIESDYEWVMEYILQKNLKSKYSTEFEVIVTEIPTDITVYKNNLDNFIFVSDDKLVNTFKMSKDYEDEEFASIIYNKIFENNIND